MTSTVEINQLVLSALDPRDAGWYKQRKACEETSSLMYPLIRQAGYTHFCDVGTNYGLVGILAAKQGLQVLCIEADPRLIAPIETHFATNGVFFVALKNAIAGAQADERSTFCLNPTSTLDNRVNMPQWESVPVPTVRVADLIEQYGFDRHKLFIKIDTQGFEENVLKGLDPYLSTHRDWAIKMEFAPQWLESQKTDPLALLNSLLDRFDVVEFPERITFGTPSLDELFRHPIKPDQAASFLEYVIQLNSARRGWVDLLVRPRA